MEVKNQTTDLFDRPRTLPSTLNVLTILTFVGCGIAYLGAIYGFFKASNYENELARMEEMQDKMSDNKFTASMLEGSLDMLRKSHEYRYVLLASGLIFTTLCLIGALQMRKLKKSGYTLYVVGELAPLVLSAVLIGFSFFGGITIAFSAIFAILFVILYGTQRKYMVA
jgi:hypothetical protein